MRASSCFKEEKKVLLNKKREGNKNESLLSLKGVTFIFSLWHSTHAIIIQGQHPPPQSPTPQLWFCTKIECLT